MKRPVSVVGLAAAVSLVIVGTTLSAQATFRGDNGRIAFASDRSGRFQIYTISPLSNRLRQLTNAPGNSIFSDWTPDGDSIVFDSDRVSNGCNEGACNVEIFIMRADGNEQTRLTRNAAFDGDPSVSPDGKWIVFDSGRDGGDLDIFVMRINGTGVTQLTDNDAVDIDPTWSPDGKWIVFSSNRQEEAALYKMKANGSSAQRLTPLRLHAGVPDWSPDGNEIVFANNADVDAPSDIFTIGPDGSEVRRLTHAGDGESYFFPSWSPNGRKLVVSFFREDNVDVATITKNGDFVSRVTTSPAVDFAPDWGASRLEPGS
jgi:Tol biopolymer transport system component